MMRGGMWMMVTDIETCWWNNSPHSKSGYYAAPAQGHLMSSTLWCDVFPPPLLGNSNSNYWSWSSHGNLLLCNIWHTAVEKQLTRLKMLPNLNSWLFGNTVFCRCKIRIDEYGKTLETRKIHIIERRRRRYEDGGLQKKETQINDNGFTKNIKREVIPQISFQKVPSSASSPSTAF